MLLVNKNILSIYEYINVLIRTVLNFRLITCPKWYIKKVDVQSSK